MKDSQMAGCPSGSTISSTYCSECRCAVLGCGNLMVYIDWDPPMRLCSRHARPNINEDAVGEELDRESSQ